MAYLVQLVVGLFKAILEVFISKPYDKKTEYNDVGKEKPQDGKDADDPFTPDDF